MTAHDPTQLGPYVLGVLDPAEARQVEDHLDGCAQCREQLVELEQTALMLDEVPPEAFLDGPPIDGDLLLRRTLRAAREHERAPATTSAESRRRRTWVMAAASVAVIAATAMGGGVLIGRATSDQAPTPSSPAVAGSRHATSTEASTGATMAITVEPRAGWSWVNVKLDGLKAGAQCELVITDASGTSHVAGSWVVSAEGARDGSTFSGGVLVPIDQVASVEVRNVEGQHVVTTTL